MKHKITKEDGTEDWLRDECGNITVYIDENGKQQFKLDENGNYTAMFSLFSDAEVNSINKALGTVTQDRFKKQEKIYNEYGLNSEFELYPANHRTIFGDTTKLFSDIDKFMKRLENKDKDRR